MRWLTESRGPYGTLDLPGLGLASTGAFGIVFGLVRAQSLGWTSTTVLVCMIGGAVLLAGFVVRELHTSEPMLPMSFFARRSFAVTNVVSLSMYFGMFGSIFFLSQYMQNVLGNTPLQAGLNGRKPSGGESGGWSVHRLAARFDLGKQVVSGIRMHAGDLESERGARLALHPISGGGGGAGKRLARPGLKKDPHVAAGGAGRRGE